MEQVNNVNANPRFDPYSNTYNEGWKHHPNFGWRSGQTQGQARGQGQASSGGNYVSNNQRNYRNDNRYQQKGQYSSTHNPPGFNGGVRPNLAPIPKPPLQIQAPPPPKSNLESMLEQFMNSQTKKTNDLEESLKKMQTHNKMLENQMAQIASALKGGGFSEGFRAGTLGVLSRLFADYSDIKPLPATELKPRDFEALLSYVNSTKHPKANIHKSESFYDNSAPVVVEFSSRGPNVIAPDILKPDITAPGVEILAAYSPLGSVSDYNGDKRSVNYSTLSGTSMSCPHVAGASVYVKSLHPDWSPSAIKSAMMTTARSMSPTKNKDAEFAYGSGHVDPVKAANPGLVYETNQDEYVTFFCRLGYNKRQIALITGSDSFSCPKKSNKSSLPNDVNYPSLSAMVDVGTPFNIKFSRTVTNVGVANSTYTVKVESPKKIKITVNPSTLSFTSLNEKKSFEVTVVGKGLSRKSNSTISASLVWYDGQHSVRSPIVVYSIYKDL
ncbi:subtilisin-like protease SBT4.13 [Chenopodium quinoa]|uniref:subtilisin-like protease SBT4.13 n=1 Tax=Chenopodium quinoa TaxID=63459 RepID=UPI000B78A708|nr:subtilisin-like protease SBT4.13 [Chenopodium quinoa]